MIEAKNVSFQYDSKGFRLQDISLKLEEGLIYTLVGENGSGKTTLLKLLYGIFPPKSGEVLWKGSPLTRRMLPAYHQEAAYIGEQWCDTGATLRANAEILRLLYPGFDGGYYEKLLAQAGLTDLQATPFRNLSTGEQCKAEMSFHLARHPKLLLMDEPLAGLDPVFKTDILELLQTAVAEEKMTVLMATNLVTEVSDIADYVGVFADGKLVKWGDRLEAVK